MLIPAVRAHDYGRAEPDILFRRIRQDGYTAVMLAYQKAIEGIGSYYQVDQEVIHKTQVTLQMNGLELRTLGVYMELGMVDEELRGQAVDQFLAGLKVAAAMGVPTVATETTPLHKQPSVTRQQAMKSLERSLGEILPHAQDLGVQVCVEPVYYHTLATPEMCAKLLQDMASPWLKLTFDPVNMMDPEQVATQEQLWDRCMEYMGPAIRLMHIKGVCWQDGKLVKSSLEDSVVDYQGLFDRVSRLGLSMHVIREEAVPQRGQEEYAFLKKLCDRYS